MPKPSQKVEVNNFIKGLITEASPLNFPENASYDEENYELNRDGTRNRRLGIGYENDYSLVTSPASFTTYSVNNTTSFKWIAVAGNADQNFLVVQSNKSLSFFDIGADSISRDGYKGKIEVTSFPADTQFSFTALEGRLVVAAGVESIAIVEYDGTNFTVTYDTIKVRDVWGVEVLTIPQYETDISYRGAFTPAHGYNLQNQSWGIPRKSEAGTLSDPTTIYNSALGVYPSNSEAVWPGLQFQPVSSGVTPFERIYTNLYTEVLGAEQSSAKGYYIIDLLKRGTSRMQAFADNKTKYPQLTYSTVTLPTDTTSGGATVVAEFSGRVWYSGFNGQVTDGDKRSPNLANFAVFSQLVRSRQDFTHCYQAGDPTSREGNDIVDTDGGFVRITGANKIVGMINLGSALVVLADNGVWSVVGGSDYGFSATNYKSTKLSSFGCIAPNSIVVEGGRAFFWSEDGIYVIAKDQFGALIVTNITDKSIQSFYEEIDNPVKALAKGVYDPVAKKVRWMYKEGSAFTSSSVAKELIMDTTIGAFYVNRYNRAAGNSVEIVDLFASEALRRGIVKDMVYVGTDQVLSGTDTVTVDTTVQQSGIQSTRYLVAVSYNGGLYYTIAYLSNSQFRDWYEVDNIGVDAEAYVVTGAVTGGDSAVAKQVPYLVTHFRKTERGVTSDLVPDKQSGCLMQSQWDWSTNNLSRKWSTPQQVYRYRRAQYITGITDEYDNGFDVVTSKSKVRGRGRAFAVRYETEPYKDCQILGWRLSVNGNALE